MNEEFFLGYDALLAVTLLVYRRNVLVAAVHRLRLIHVHLVELVELADSVDGAVGVEVDQAAAGDGLGEGHVDELRLELEVEDFCGQVLASGVVKRNGAVFTASDEEVTVRGVCDGSDRLAKLSEVVADAGLLNIEDTHGARLETAGKDWQRGMGRHAERLVDRARELDNLVKGGKVP